MRIPCSLSSFPLFPSLTTFTEYYRSLISAHCAHRTNTEKISTARKNILLFTLSLRSTLNTREHFGVKEFTAPPPFVLTKILESSERIRARARVSRGEATLDEDAAQVRLAYAPSTLATHARQVPFAPRPQAGRGIAVTRLLLLFTPACSSFFLRFFATCTRRRCNVCNVKIPRARE